MKTCVNCQYMHRFDFGDWTVSEPYCRHPEVAASPVYGVNPVLCAVARERAPCGAEGALFVQYVKPPSLLRRLLAHFA